MYCLANPSLCGTTKNDIPQNFETHPTSKQHRSHIKRIFHFTLCIKILPKSYWIWDMNWIFKKLILIFKMSGWRKSFKKVTLGFPLFKDTKETFFHFFNVSIFRRPSNNPLFYLFNRSWIEATTFFWTIFKGHD